MKYSKKYSSPKDAERHFHEVLSQMSIEDTPLEADIHLVSPVTTRSLIEAVKSLPDEVQLKSISESFSMFAEDKHNVYIQPDFLQFVVSASEHLFQCGRSNVVYTLAKAIGRKRPDGSDSRFPAKRMPMGLLEHMVNFYNADSYTQVNRTNDVVSAF